MQISFGFVCDFKNKDFVELIFCLKLLLEYSIFLTENGKSKEVFQYYNYVFEKYLPESSNLSKVNYNNLFLGKYHESFSIMYRDLVFLWMKLQDNLGFLTSDIETMRVLYKKISLMTGEYKSKNKKNNI